MSDAVPKIGPALLAVMREAAVSKTTKGFVADEVFHEIRGLLIKHQIMIRVKAEQKSEKQVGKAQFAAVQVEVTFVHVEDSSEWAVSVPGGATAQNLRQVPAALTGALKSALRMQFLLSGEKVAEPEDPPWDESEATDEALHWFHSIRCTRTIDELRQVTPPLGLTYHEREYAKGIWKERKEQLLGLNHRDYAQELRSRDKERK